MVAFGMEIFALCSAKSLWVYIFPDFVIIWYILKAGIYLWYVIKVG